MNCCAAACRVCRGQRVNQDAIELRAMVEMRDLEEFERRLWGMCERHLDLLCDALRIPVYRRPEAYAC